jgi:hypothetical protein
MIQAEARDNRQLSANERAAFEEHAESCAACQRELQALAALREAVLQVPTLEAAPVHARRIRGLLLEQIREQQSAAKGSGSWQLLAVAAVAALAVTAAVVRNYTVRDHSAVALRPLAESPVFEVVNVEGAVVTNRVDGGTARSTLARGVASFHVSHLRAGQRFLLKLPDGELEVHGTRFVTSVQNDRTQRVEVSEGVVALRLQGEPERFLRAGEHWSAPSVVPAAPAPTPVPVDDGPTRPSPRSDRRVMRVAARNIEPPTSAQPAAQPNLAGAPELSAGPRFVAAASAFQAGSYARADALLAAFLRDFPRDSRCEDAAFLRAMAHSRMGDRTRAAALAQSYLNAYPHGLRRREAETLMRPR